MIRPTTSPALLGASPATTSSAASSPTPASATSPTGTLGKNEFLSLLVTQLRNQDPLSPLQPYEFAAQLAQFSSVEQLTQLNDAMSTQNQQSQLVAALVQTQFGSGLLGKEILAEGDQIEIPKSGAAQMQVEIPGAGGDAKLTLTDDNGRVLATRDLGSLAPGKQTLTLPGDLPPGVCHVKIDVTGANGKSAAATTYETGVVSGVHFANGGLTLRIGSLDIPLGALVEVHPAPAAS